MLPEVATRSGVGARHRCAFGVCGGVGNAVVHHCTRRSVGRDRGQVARGASTVALLVSVVVVLAAVVAAAPLDGNPDRVGQTREGGSQAAHVRVNRDLATGTTFEITVQSDNTMTVVFSTPVTRAADGSTTLVPSDFVVSISGGVATLTSFSVSAPSSVAGGEVAYTLTLSLDRDPDGVEVVTVDVAADQVLGTGSAAVAQDPKSYKLFGVGYPNVAVLIEGKLYIAWLRREGPQLVDCKVVLQANAWVGIAFDADAMVGTNGAIIAVPGGGGSVQRYNLTAQTAGGMVVAAAQDLTATSVEQSGGVTVAKWTMPMPPASPTATRNVIFAYGSSNTLSAEVDNGATTLDLTAQPGCNASSSCHGHGTCNGTRCVCSTEYTAIDCGVCSVGFSRPAGSGVAGQCSADYAAATVRILLPSSSFGTTGSAARDTFLNAFEQQIAAAIAVGMPASRVVITRMRIADGLVDFELWRAAVNSTSPAHIRDMSVVVMVQRLVAAFGNSTSVLYAAASSVTKHLDPATPPQFVYGTKPPPPVHGVSHSVVLLPGVLTMSWVMGDAAVTITATATATAWVSIGFNDDPVMVGADAVVGEPVAGAVREYYLGGKDLPLLKLQSMQDLRNTSIGQRDGVTVMQFTRALDPAAVASASGQHRRLRSGSSSRQLSDGTSTKGNVPITARGQTAVVFAVGSSNTFSAHDLDRRGALYVNFFTGDVQTPGLQVLQVLHAVSMTLAWVVFIPAGIWVAMFGRRRRPVSGKHAWWFVRHQALHYTALVLIICGVVSSFNMVDGIHLATTHSWFGAVVAAVALLQPVVGTLRPAKGATKRRVWKWCHKGSGRLATLLAVPTIILGITALGIGIGYVITFCVVTLLLLCVTAVWHFRGVQLFTGGSSSGAEQNRRLSMVVGGGGKKKKTGKRKKKKKKKSKKATIERRNDGSGPSATAAGDDADSDADDFAAAVDDVVGARDSRSEPTETLNPVWQT